MMAANKRSTAVQVDKAFVRLVKNRDKFGFPPIDALSEINDNWHITYSIPYNSLAEIRGDVKLLIDNLGKVPWGYEPRAKTTV